MVSWMANNKWRVGEIASPLIEDDGLSASQKKQIDARIEEAEKRFKTEKKITLDEAVDGLKQKLRKQYNM